jgi:hypothetical protein
VAVLGRERMIDRSINGIAASIFSAPTAQAGSMMSADGRMTTLESNVDRRLRGSEDSTQLKLSSSWNGSKE